MNQGPDFQQPDDDFQDPLLRALREHLGAGFGQEPPPALWASIRGQLPSPRPWWRRPRRLLPLLALLAGLLVVGGLAVQQAYPPHQPAATAAGGGTKLPRPATQPTQDFSIKSLTPNTYTDTSGGQSPAGKVIAAPGAGLARSLASNQATAGRRPAANASTPVRPAKTGQPNSSPVAVSETARPLVARGRRHQPLAATGLTPAGASLRAGEADHAHHQARRPGNVAATTSQYNHLSESTIPKEAAFGYPARPRPQLAAGATLSPARPAGSRRPAPRGQRRLAEGAGGLAAATNQRQHGRQPLTGQTLSLNRDYLLAGHRLPPGAATPPGAPAATALVRPACLDSLAARPNSILLLTSTLPNSLTARADSSGPWLPPVRRWSVLVLAGPSVSYRTLPTQATGLAYSSLPSTTVSFGAGASSTSSVAELERPALGLGAQVQVRRVLTGRWALALGAGYQEYATRLAGQAVIQRIPNGYHSTTTDSLVAVHQRDTYQLFTLPVQLSYALGPPRGRLALGLLAGFEPSLYVGGRATVVSTNSVYQQAFTTASGSPYNALSLAFSLGLDARYRLGRPASRWQLVVQPAGRYLATPFVRSTALGYARRQPYSLGLLTGLSWEF